MRSSFLYCLIFLFSVITCQPIDYSSLQSSVSEGPKDASPSLTDSLAEVFPSSVFALPGQKEFKDQFTSDKLDLVFVLDTSPAMARFYNQNHLGASFLQKFKSYDWKFAYTDMSVDMEQLVENSEDEGKESCGFLKGAAMTVGGFFVGGPFLAGLGLDKMYDCVSSLKIRNKNTGFSNGDFLPFEYNGAKVQSETFHQLTPRVQNYNAIFDHSLKLGDAKKSSYSAPIQRNSQAYPLLSTTLSIAKNKASYSDQTSSPSSFFRKDSSIVYVLITVQDIQMSLSPELFSQSLEFVFGSKNRLRLIPITLGENSPVFCDLKLQKGITDSQKLKKLSRSLGSHSLDICSSNLPEELFVEISKSLYPKDFLSK